MYGAGDVRVENVPDPSIVEPTDAILRVVRACVCGSDLWPYNDMPRSEIGQSMGHEAIGVVEAVGRDVRTIKRGQVVVMPFAISDGTCEFCREGLPTACVHVGFVGNRGMNGAQAEALRIPFADGTLYPIDVTEGDARMPSLLTLSDVMGTGHHAAVIARVRPGHRVASSATASSACAASSPRSGWAPSRSSWSPSRSGYAPMRRSHASTTGHHGRTSLHGATTPPSRSRSIPPAGSRGSRTTSRGTTSSPSCRSACRTTTSRSSAPEASRTCSRAPATSTCRSREKIATRFGVKTLMLEGGGRIDGGMLRAGLVDEVSVLVAPVVDGRSATPALFDLEPGALAPGGLALVHVERRAGDVLWLRYRVTHVP